MGEKQLQLPEGVTPEMVVAWKQKFGEKSISLATIHKDEDNTDPMDVIIRQPKRPEISEFEKWIDRNPDKAKSILVNSCLLTKKEEVIASPEGYFLSAFAAIMKVYPKPDAVVKNL